MNEWLAECDNDEFYNNVKGCRSGSNAALPSAGMSGGVCSFMTLSGFMLAIQPNLYRETPTQVILDLFKCLTQNKATIKYFNIMEAMGWDMMCNILGRLLKLMSKELLSADMLKFWSDDILSRLFVDRFHIAKHVCELCSLHCIHSNDSNIAPKKKPSRKTKTKIKSISNNNSETLSKPKSDFN